MQRLIARIEEAPATFELAASKAAQETVRLVSETAAGSRAQQSGSTPFTATSSP